MHRQLLQVYAATWQARAVSHFMGCLGCRTSAKSTSVKERKWLLGHENYAYLRIQVTFHLNDTASGLSLLMFDKG